MEKQRERKKEQLIIQARRCTIYQTAFIYYYANGQMQNICSDIFAAC